MFTEVLFTIAKIRKQPVSINRWMNKQYVVYTYNGIFLRHENHWTLAICDNMCGFRRYYTKWYIIYCFFIDTLTNDHQFGSKQNPFIVAMLSKYRSGWVWLGLSLGSHKTKSRLSPGLYSYLEVLREIPLVRSFRLLAESISWHV